MHKLPPRNRSRRAGFTLIELVVVVLVIGIIAAIAAPKVLDLASSSRVNATRQSLTVIRDALEVYRSQNDGYPPSANLATTLRPYLRTPFPTAHIGNLNANVVATTQDPITTPEAGGAGWVYNQTTGHFSVNHADGIAW